MGLSMVGSTLITGIRAPRLRWLNVYVINIFCKGRLGLPTGGCFYIEGGGGVRKNLNEGVGCVEQYVWARRGRQARSGGVGAGWGCA